MENHMSSYEVETNTILNIYTIIIKTITILGSLSLLSSLLVISMFLLKKHIRTFVCELIFYLAISEVFNSTSKILSIYRITLYTDIEQGLSDGTSLLCLIQRVFSIYSDFSTLILSMVISFALYDLMKRMNKDAVVRRMKCFRLTTFILPLIPTLS